MVQIESLVSVIKGEIRGTKLKIIIIKIREVKI
jgi:hypothetical protein